MRRKNARFVGVWCLMGITAQVVGATFTHVDYAARSVKDLKHPLTKIVLTTIFELIPIG
jgi:hypothetical protein